MNRFVRSLVLLFCATAPLVAQLDPNDAPISNGPLGGSPVTIVVNPLDSNEVIVFKDGNNPGLWRSLDRGVTFAPYGNGLPDVLYPLVENLTVDPMAPNVLYANHDKNIYKSTDFGANWAPMPFVAAESIKTFSVASSGGGMLALDSFNIYHSADNGATWSVVHSVVPFAGVVLDDVQYAPGDPSIAYAAGNDSGLLRSTDGGASFSPLGHTELWIQTLTVDPTDADRVYVGTPFDGLHRSTDGGVNFAQVAQNLTPVFNGEFFAWNADGSVLWYAVLDGVLRSTDKGDTWALFEDGISADFTPIPLDMRLAPNGDWYLGQVGGGLYDQSGGGLFRLDAGTSTWDHIGFLEGQINDVAIAGPGGVRVAGLGSGVYAAAGGDQVVPTAWHADIGTGTRAVAVDPDDPDRWVTGGVGAFFDNGQIVVVTNNGTEFTKPYDMGAMGQGGAIVYDIEFSPFDSDRVVAGMYPGAFGNESIITSTDGGDSWVEIPGTIGWASVAVTFNPFQDGHVMQLSENSQWSQSFNGGLNWQDLKPSWPGTGPAMLLDFDPFVPGRIFRGETGSGLWRSDDGGATWNTLGVSLHSESSVVFHPEFPNMLWVGDDEGNLLISGDGGDSFAVVWDVHLNAKAGAMAIDTSDGTLVVGTTLASMWELPGGSPVVRIGDGTAGTGGVHPTLTLGGGLPQLGNAGFSLAGEDIVGGATVYMALGFTQQSQSVFGGSFEIGAPIWRLYAAGGVPGLVGDGSFVAPFGLPVNPALLGLEVFAQMAVPDAGTVDPSQVALSNALSITFHN